jgi:hypothetical protein
MSEITGSKEFVAFGDQGQRPPDPQPERVVMVGPDGRTVQVMAEDVPAFAERGFVRRELTQPVADAPAKPRRPKATPADEQEAN